MEGEKGNRREEKGGEEELIITSTYLAVATHTVSDRF